VSSECRFDPISIDGRSRVPLLHHMSVSLYRVYV